jgi:hypothetical protein
MVFLVNRLTRQAISEIYNMVIVAKKLAMSIKYLINFRCALLVHKDGYQQFWTRRFIPTLVPMEDGAWMNVVPNQAPI